MTLAPDDLQALVDAIELDAGQELVVDLAARTVSSRAGTIPCGIPDGARQQLLTGSWDATSVLLEAGERIEATAARLPYVSGYAE